MRQKIYQIDAFTTQTFGGNPAAVCILDSWLSPELMQKIAQENHLAETAFAVKREDIYEIRWFTPEVEVDLCGHATLATAYVIFHFYELEKNTIQFYSSRSGDLFVNKADNNWLTMDFPADTLVAIKNIDEIDHALGKSPIKTFKGKTDYMLVYNSQKEIEELAPNFFLLDQVDARGVIVTAPGTEVDFVSRFFAPSCGIPEDPVTGSAHTSMSPYWSKELDKTKMTAKQLSKRGGDLVCEMLDNRVKISGKAVPYLFGEIEI
ncbi:PhzF family phenazine biosynthesis protein [Flagellimonas zhangzhouensis]|uniref:Phenazine biosynthesis protein PhzF family n=1 Tax=Flagellimonas zhangzhouensis TaxID=1073328 RepID=A0A1H2UJC7_9FLAO|nr:PhzF family phenazine biosynthesis protein [Allomuricauda zhangzhouensis]SDQ16536.1 phenazine biosynthesis protein PhzF family [Allomuricauda zhangzhouensis]SDW56177.1 phenazine biosynthesis protein PhzF family [Allomuricauda zhangzhouensis]